MYGMLLSPTTETATSLLASLYRSMTLRNEPQSEFVGTNQAMGDLNPIITRWLETGRFNPSRYNRQSDDTLFQFRMYMPKSSIADHMMFWKKDVPIESDCLGTHYSRLFSSVAVEHLKKSEYLIICDELHSSQRQNHFEHLAHLFLQMYNLDCSLKRIAFVIHCPSDQQPSQESPIDIAKRVFGAECYDVFKTFCKVKTRFDFFMVDVFNLLPNAHHPCTLDQWIPEDAINPFLFAVSGLPSERTMTLKGLEILWKQ